MALVHAAADYRPSRVLILGSAGFVGSAVQRKLEAADVEVVGIPRTALDLTDAGAADRLVGLLRADDALLFAAAEAPVKSIEMLMNNLRMAETVCAALAEHPVAHLIYLSSDAVYADGPLPLNEESMKAPGSLHGVMHLTREMMLASVCSDALCIVRPTLIYGPGDPHNGYGPNQFLTLVRDGLPIVLFGEGEERRDHVHIEDVADLVSRIIFHQSTGELNIATGDVVSFREAAEQVISVSGSGVAIETSPRSGPMPHGGYRPFDPTATQDAFPDFAYRTLAEGISRA